MALSDITIDEGAKTVRVRDPRAFRAGRRAFCRRLVDAATRQPGVRKVEVDLASTSCRVEFGPGSAHPQDMANAFAAAVREAAADAEVPERIPSWRRSTDWSALTAYSLHREVSLWETLEIQPGRIRLRNPGLASDHGRLSQLADGLPGLDGIEACRVAPWSHTLTVAFRPETANADRLLDDIQRVLEDMRVSAPLHADRPPAAPGVDAPEVATGLLYLRNLALAAGSFALTFVALLVPGMPTVPFLLATSYYLARSSPWLDEKLRRTAFFGPILTEWEQYGGLSRRSKEKLIGLSGVIHLATVVLTPLSPLTVAVIVLIWFVSIYAITRLPRASPGTQRADPAR